MTDAANELSNLQNKVMNKEVVSAQEYARVVEGLRAARTAGDTKSKKKTKSEPVRVDFTELLLSPVKTN